MNLPGIWEIFRRLLTLLFMLSVFGFAFFGMYKAAFGASYTYTCADFPLGGGIGGTQPTCSADDFHFTGNDGYMYESSPVFPFTPGDPYYFVGDVSGSGDLIFYISGATSPFFTVSAPELQFTKTLTAPAGTGVAFVQSSYPLNSYSGHLTNFCVSDTSYAECLAPVPPTPPAELTATSSIEQTQQNIYLMYFVFLSSFFIILWFFI